MIRQRQNAARSQPEIGRSRLSAPSEHKTCRNAMAPGNLGYLRARHQRFFHNPRLLIGRPPPPTLDTAKNLNPHRSTLKLDLRSHASGKAAAIQDGAARKGTMSLPARVVAPAVRARRSLADGTCLSRGREAPSVRHR